MGTEITGLPIQVGAARPKTLLRVSGSGGSLSLWKLNGSHVMSEHGMDILYHSKSLSHFILLIEYAYIYIIKA